MGQDFHQLNPLQEEDFAALGFLDSAAYMVTPSDLQRAVSMGNAPQDQAAWTDLQDFSVAASSQNSHSPANALESGEESAPGPMRRLRQRRKVAEKKQSLSFSSEDEEESAKIEEGSDDDYDDRLERTYFRKGKEKTKEKSGVKEFKCLDSGCVKAFGRAWDMRIHHRKVHEGELAERCEKCKNYYAADKSDLAKHSMVCGNGSDPKNKERSFCPYSDCGRVYKNHEFLEAHIARDHAQQAASTE